jgi:hypothetical protein
VIAQHTDRITLASILPRLPAEAHAFFNGLGPRWHRSAEHVLNIVGADSFVTHWEHQRAEIKRLSWDFGVDLRSD